MSKKLRYPDITKVIYTDASIQGWGACCEGMSTGGSWINTQKSLHINALELRAIILSIMSFVKEHGIHVKVFETVLLP